MSKAHLCLEGSKLFPPRTMKRIFGRALRAFLVCAVAGTVITGCPATGDDEELQGPRITSFVINHVEGVINQNRKAIKVTLPLDTDVTALLPKVEFVGANIDPDPAKEEKVNFSEVVKYTVYSKDGSAFPYMVTVILEIEEDFSAGSYDLFTVRNTEEWDNAVDLITDGGNDKNYLINVIEDFDVAGVTSVTFGDVTGITVMIRGNHQIGLSSIGYLLYAGEGQSVILRDITLKGWTDNNKAVVRIAVGAEAEMRGTAIITGNKCKGGFGGGLDVSGIFTMRDETSVFDNHTGYGGGVNVSSGGIFTMRDYASATRNGAAYGGGVSVTDSGTTFIMQDDAFVSDNYATRAGGVWVDLGATFTMRDYTSVSGNTAGSSGGGVIAYDGGTFTMQDNASVSGNTAQDPYYSGGGGVSISGGSFIMRDNTSVFSNTANNNGGGVLLDNYRGTIRIAGGTVYGPDGSKNVTSGVDKDFNQNTAGKGNAVLHLTGGTTEWGSFNIDGTWAKGGDLQSTNDTVKVVNGVKQ